jgi:hypothetical protein
MKTLPALVLLSVLCGCQHQALHVKCDRQLEPINAPAPVVRVPAPESATSP